MIELYSGPLSLFAAKVRIALAEKGLAHEVIEVPFSRERAYEPKHPEVSRLNPKQQVPVLVHDDLVLYDSTVIIEYLEDLCPDPGLFPRQPGARARCRMLELEADEVAFPPTFALVQARFYGVQADAAQLEPPVRANHVRLAEQLGDQPFLCGAFSVADVAHALVIGFAAGVGVAPEPPSLQRWLSRVSERPSVQTQQARMLEALARLQTAA